MMMSENTDVLVELNGQNPTMLYIHVVKKSKMVLAALWIICNQAISLNAIMNHHQSSLLVSLQQSNWEEAEEIVKLAANW